jgi:two-component system phosphate regulon sensor histidine kinase PhoR
MGAYVNVDKQTLRLEDDRVQVRAVFDSMGEGLITINAEGVITSVNSYATTALGYREDELVNEWYSEAIIAVDQHKAALEPIARPIVRALTLGESVSDYSYYLRRDGSMMPVSLTVSPILIDGRPSGAIELFRDITSERQLDLAKDEFVSLASHQLRTPASGVKAILSMVLAEDFGPLTEKQSYYLQKAVDGNNRQIQIIEDILNAARIDSGKLEIEFERIDLVDLIEDVIKELSTEISLRKQDVAIQGLKHLTIWGDSGKLRMAFENLIGNASKYTPHQGTVTIAIDTSDEYARVRITDNGVGIAAKNIPQLFTKFIRIENELSDVVGGTGLGLYLAKNIIELHRGSIAVESIEHSGTTFTLLLPMRMG